MENQTVICGAGLAGIATAYYLSVKYGQKDIVLLDRFLPMSFTTSKSGENYRNYW
ncbi:MAG TPA: FAD-dependent oxidoreductase, partial [Pseudomonadales bacterium]|nr:FAD-dependent oxidoreductase [Pseudomonadales bacterium]